jgi:hypothetical protein
MDLFQSLATVILLTLVIYFIMVNLDGRMRVIKSVGDIKQVLSTTTAPERSQTAPERSQTAPERASTALITNQLPPGGPKLLREGLNVAFDPHNIDRMEPTVNDGYGPNLTTSAVFNPEAQGIVPVNHDLFERRADFGSDLTNINQFYRNNPEIFHKSQINVPDVASWNAMSDQMHQSHVLAPTEPAISAANSIY